MRVTRRVKRKRATRTPHGAPGVLLLAGGLGLLWLLSGSPAFAAEVAPAGGTTGTSFTDGLKKLAASLGLGVLGTVAKTAGSALFGGTAGSSIWASSGAGAAGAAEVLGEIGGVPVTGADLAANPELAYALAQGPSGAPPSPPGAGEAIMRSVEALTSAPASGSEIVGVVGTKAITAEELAQNPELAYAIAQGPSGAGNVVGTVGGAPVTAEELAQNPELAYAIAAEGGAPASAVAGTVGGQAVTYTELAANPELAYAIALEGGTAAAAPAGGAVASTVGITAGELAGAAGGIAGMLALIAQISMTIAGYASDKAAARRDLDNVIRRVVSTYGSASNAIMQASVQEAALILETLWGMATNPDDAPHEHMERGLLAFGRALDTAIPASLTWRPDDYPAPSIFWVGDVGGTGVGDGATGLADYFSIPGVGSRLSPEAAIVGLIRTGRVGIPQSGAEAAQLIAPYWAGTPDLIYRTYGGEAVTGTRAPTPTATVELVPVGDSGYKYQWVEAPAPTVAQATEQMVMGFGGALVPAVAYVPPEQDSR